MKTFVLICALIQGPAAFSVPGYTAMKACLDAGDEVMGSFTKAVLSDRTVTPSGERAFSCDCVSGPRRTR